TGTFSASFFGLFFAAARLDVGWDLGALGFGAPFFAAAFLGDDIVRIEWEEIDGECPRRRNAEGTRQVSIVSLWSADRDRVRIGLIRVDHRQRLQERGDRDRGGGAIHVVV